MVHFRDSKQTIDRITLDPITLEVNGREEETVVEATSLKGNKTLVLEARSPRSTPTNWEGEDNMHANQNENEARRANVPVAIPSEIRQKLEEWKQKKEHSKLRLEELRKTEELLEKEIEMDSRSDEPEIIQDIIEEEDEASQDIIEEEDETIQANCTTQGEDDIKSNLIIDDKQQHSGEAEDKDERMNSGCNAHEEQNERNSMQLNKERGHSDGERSVGDRDYATALVDTLHEEMKDITNTQMNESGPANEEDKELTDPSNNDTQYLDRSGSNSKSNSSFELESVKDESRKNSLSSEDVFGENLATYYLDLNNESMKGEESTTNLTKISDNDRIIDINDSGENNSSDNQDERSDNQDEREESKPYGSDNRSATSHNGSNVVSDISNGGETNLSTDDSFTQVECKMSNITIGTDEKHPDHQHISDSGSKSAKDSSNVTHNITVGTDEKHLVRQNITDSTAGSTKGSYRTTKDIVYASPRSRLRKNQLKMWQDKRQKEDHGPTSNVFSVDSHSKAERVQGKSKTLIKNPATTGSRPLLRRKEVIGRHDFATRSLRNPRTKISINTDSRLLIHTASTAAAARDKSLTPKKVDKMRPNNSRFDHVKSKLHSPTAATVARNSSIAQQKNSPKSPDTKYILERTFSSPKNITIQETKRSPVQRKIVRRNSTSPKSPLTSASETSTFVRKSPKFSLNSTTSPKSPLTSGSETNNFVRKSAKSPLKRPSSRMSSERKTIHMQNIPQDYSRAKDAPQEILHPTTAKVSSPRTKPVPKARSDKHKSVQTDLSLSSTKDNRSANEIDNRAENNKRCTTKTSSPKMNKKPTTKKAVADVSLRCAEYSSESKLTDNLEYRAAGEGEVKSLKQRRHSDSSASMSSYDSEEDILLNTYQTDDKIKCASNQILKINDSITANVLTTKQIQQRDDQSSSNSNSQSRRSLNQKVRAQNCTNELIFVSKNSTFDNIWATLTSKNRCLTCYGGEEIQEEEASEVEAQAPTKDASTEIPNFVQENRVERTLTKTNSKDFFIEWPKNAAEKNEKAKELIEEAYRNLDVESMAKICHKFREEFTIARFYIGVLMMEKDELEKKLVNLSESFHELTDDHNVAQAENIQLKEQIIELHSMLDANDSTTQESMLALEREMTETLQYAMNKAKGLQKELEMSHLKKNMLEVELKKVNRITR